MTIMNTSQLLHAIARALGRPDAAASTRHRARALLALDEWISREGQDYDGLLRDIRANRDYPDGLSGKTLRFALNAADSDSTPLSDGENLHSPDNI